MDRTYAIQRWQKDGTPEGTWRTVRGGYTRERAEELVRNASLDYRYALMKFRVVEETPAPTPAEARAAEVNAGIALDARVTRAAVQGTDWTWTPQGDGSFICETTPGHAYCVSPTYCTCPDHQYRTVKTGVPCKHRIGLATKALLEGWEPATPAYPLSPADLARPVRVAA